MTDHPSTDPAGTATPPTIAPSTLPRTDSDALADALRAEVAAIYAYGTVAAYALPGRMDQIAGHVAAHRARREAVIGILTDAGRQTPAAAAGYTLPFPVDDPESAARLAATAEQDCAVAWRSVLERAHADGTRAFALPALSDAAVRAGKWRVALDVAPPTIRFPGTPDEDRPN